MTVRCCRSGLLILCLCLVGFICSSAGASTTLPWQTANSVGNALLQQNGASVVCEGVVERIAARNKPAYFVMKDQLAVGNTAISNSRLE